MPNPEFKWLNRLGIGRVILMAAALIGFTIYHSLRWSNPNVPRGT